MNYTNLRLDPINSGNPERPGPISGVGEATAFVLYGCTQTMGDVYLATLHPKFTLPGGILRSDMVDLWDKVIVRHKVDDFLYMTNAAPLSDHMAGVLAAARGTAKKALSSIESQVTPMPMPNGDLLRPAEVFAALPEKSLWEIEQDGAGKWAMTHHDTGLRGAGFMTHEQARLMSINLKNPWSMPKLRANYEASFGPVIAPEPKTAEFCP